MPATVIDCHTHAYPQELSADPLAWTSIHDEAHWAKLVAPSDRPSIQDWATPERMLADMDAAGIDQAVLLGWYWEHAATCCWHNQTIADWVKTAPDRFIGFAAIHPGEALGQQLEAAAELGLRGVGELHHGVQGFNARSEGWLELADWCSKNNWPVNLHVTGTIGRQHPDAVATPHDEIIALAESAPELSLVLAHWGGDLLLHPPETGPIDLPQNVYFDCSASPLLHSADVFEQAFKRAGPDKLLFGSDYPLRLFPRHQKQADFRHYLDYIKRDTTLDAKTLEALMGENFKRLLN
ncbi:MAG: amidohydrolase family protein [Verrucomicrobia bacterium]|nr:amidohydrolase family protein [Verrucomicrobiota bacterium]